MWKFQLTRPVWGEPIITHILKRRFPISTHSPRVGRTNERTDITLSSEDFNSLAPCGANHVLQTISRDYRTFQLTRPVWGEPFANNAPFYRVDISTHSPRVGRTRHAKRSGSSTRPFQLTRPVWGEPRSVVSDRSTAAISTHSPRVGRTE